MPKDLLPIRRPKHKYTLILRLIDLFIALAFFILPLFTVDMILMGRVGKVTLFIDRVYVRGVERGIPIEAYFAAEVNPIAAIIRYLAYFMAFFAAADVSMKVDPYRPDYRRCSYLFGVLVAVHTFLWFCSWLLSARFAPFMNPGYEYVLRILNFISACNISYWVTLYYYFTTPLWPISIVLLIAIYAAYELRRPVVGFVERAVRRRAMRRVMKMLMGSDPAAELAREFKSLVEDNKAFWDFGRNFAENILMWRARFDAFSRALDVMPKGLAPKICREIKEFSTTNEELRKLGLKILEKAREELEEARAHAPLPGVRGPAPKAQPPIQPAQGGAAGREPSTPVSVQKPVAEGEVEGRRKDTVETERRRAEERARIYNEIVSLKVFDGVVGLREVKEEVAWRFLIPLLFPEKAPKGVEPRLGILLYGPPGTGKSEAMRAIAGACERFGIRAFEIDPARVNRMFVGQGEEFIQRTFAEARRAPSIILIDEADVAMRRPAPFESHGHRGPVAQLLQEMDGIAAKHGRMLIIAATNKPWEIDEAFLRPGRIDMMFYVGPPEREERIELFRRGLAQLDVEGPIDFKRLADLTEPSRVGYYSGADILGACRRASVKAAKAGRRVTMADLEEAVKEAKPTIPAYLIDDFKRFAGVRHGEPSEVKKREEQPFYTS